MLAMAYLDQVLLLRRVARESTISSVAKLLVTPHNIVAEELEFGIGELRHASLIPLLRHGRMLLREMNVITPSDVNGNDTPLGLVRIAEQLDDELPELQEILLRLPVAVEDNVSIPPPLIKWDLLVLVPMFFNQHLRS